MAPPLKATRIGDGVYRVERDGRSEIVYVAGPPGDRWAFCDGAIFRAGPGTHGARPTSGRQGAQSLTAPMPATVVKILVAPGLAVKKGDTVIVLEAMKMELPIRAPADAVVTAVRCREGELVQPETTLLELE